ncbi:uncharacterized protein DS421_6g178990 [Arachis hypogaea]|nr:uncharacterized protein DS421_6g178990 [Arachis hypogaea]
MPLGLYYRQKKYSNNKKLEITTKFILVYTNNSLKNWNIYLSTNENLFVLCLFFLLFIFVLNRITCFYLHFLILTLISTFVLTLQPLIQYQYHLLTLHANPDITSNSLLQPSNITLILIVIIVINNDDLKDRGW